MKTEKGRKFDRLYADKSEEDFVKKLSLMSDPDLIAEWGRLNTKKRSRGSQWWVWERKLNFISLELLERGFSKIETWVKK